MSIAEKLRGWCTDWNGAPMVRGEPPRDGLHCGDLLDAASEIDRLTPYVEAFRREEDRADKAERDLDDAMAALRALDAALCDGFGTRANRMAGRKALIAARAIIAKVTPT